MFSVKLQCHPHSHQWAAFLEKICHLGELALMCGSMHKWVIVLFSFSAYHIPINLTLGQKKKMKHSNLQSDDLLKIARPFFFCGKGCFFRCVLIYPPERQRLSETWMSFTLLSVIFLKYPLIIQSMLRGVSETQRSISIDTPTYLMWLFNIYDASTMCSHL